MDIHELYVAISNELEQLESMEDEAAKTDRLWAIQDAMDQYKAHQTESDFRRLREFFDRDGKTTTKLPEKDDLTSEGIEIPLLRNSPLKLFFDNLSTVMLAGEVLLEEGLWRQEDIDIEGTD